MPSSPFDVARVNGLLDTLEKKAKAQMDRDGIAISRRRFQFSIDMRHRGQINEVEVLLPEKRLKSAIAFALHSRFYARYEQLYGRGSSYGEARLEIVTLRLRATAAVNRRAYFSGPSLGTQVMFGGQGRGSRPRPGRPKASVL